jgi:hypothetical protein
VEKSLFSKVKIEMSRGGGGGGSTCCCYNHVILLCTVLYTLQDVH